ncbi:hypothetical protein OG948_31770 [Embleya sp. NBC_00888]|uniref:hypothetical protein n=1 Tax=Embleya sp. NBC_00888 TaxID=2975960 RepID=UPI00386D3783|nr:hypothetical protein OG948_31770 [Embleya sp. NBC_00888]
MRKILDIFGLLLVLQGVGGMIHHFFGWFRLWTLLTRQSFLHGHEVAASIALIVLGFAVWIVAEKVLPTEKEKNKRRSISGAQAEQDKR